MITIRELPLHLPGFEDPASPIECASAPASGPMAWSLLVIVWLALTPPTAWAGSFRIYDHSASATGQASAFTAQADDASAGYYNPAGMTQLPGVQFSAGTTLIGGGFSFQNAAGLHTHGDLRGSIALPPPSNLYLTAGSDPPVRRVSAKRTVPETRHP